MITIKDQAAMRAIMDTDRQIFLTIEPDPEQS